MKNEKYQPLWGVWQKHVPHLPKSTMYHVAKNSDIPLYKFGRNLCVIESEFIEWAKSRGKAHKRK
jgi:hypothetical protein